MSKINIASHHPILDIQDNIIFANNGNVLACYKVLLPEIHSLSETDFEGLHSNWSQAFKSLPIGTVIHKQDMYLKSSFTSDYLRKDTFLSKATHDHFKGREYMEHQSYLFFTCPRRTGFNNPKYVNPFARVSKALPRELDDSVKQFLDAVNDAVNYLNNGQKIRLEPMVDGEILALTQNQLNGHNPDCDTDIVLDGPKVAIGNHHFDVLAINSESCFGDSVQTSKINERFTSDDFSFHQGFIDGLGLSLKENHIINQIVYLDDRHHWRRQLEKKVEELKKSSNFGTQNKVALKKIEHILDQINQDDQARIVRGHLNIIHWHRDGEQLKRTNAQVRAELKELDMVPYYPCGKERKNYILNSFPCFAPNFSNEDLYVADLKHALCLWINTTNYSTDSTGIVFNDREFNIPVLKDVWDEQKKRIKARNFAIFAPTGEGKSFLANNILRQYFESDVRLVIIDLGGSYTKFASLYPEQCAVLRYENGKSLGINPFYISNSEDVTPERLEDLSLFLFELMGKGTKSQKETSVALKKILLAYYKENQTALHTLDSFYQFVSRHQKGLLSRLQIHAEYFNINGFLHILSEYVGDGIYSFLFVASEDRPYRLEDKRLIVFELDEVKDNKEILSVMLKLIKTAIQRTVWINREERGIILFDEFAKQLKFDNVLESVEFYYQAIRKQEGAIGIILQSINQLPQNPTSASILENTQIIYSLRNEKGYGALKERLHLSSHDLDQLRSMRNNLTGKRKYTEIFIKIGKESNIFRLEVPPEVYAAYLTDGPDNKAIMELYKETGCMETAIKKFIHQKSITS
ncbi:TraG family conjugative transposon ATPase [Allomuricauda sp. F6463D]|uniref:TraG family conjugative transposon ATPase n=1 Tax=Allomuricauda sp. F6463D TaxID=2926409 RepID=UPI001FF57CF0|nr:TraG family conjugative transposon ATPase [Muricauda sp. F6463D]MCK0160469.1 TraG family conjugative transposon ATPase [Muricauda sp. F6463D]